MIMFSLYKIPSFDLLERTTTIHKLFTILQSPQFTNLIIFSAIDCDGICFPLILQFSWNLPEVCNGIFRVLLKPHSQCSTHVTNPIMKHNLRQKKVWLFQGGVMTNNEIQGLCMKIPGKHVLCQLEEKHWSLKWQKRIACRRTVRGNKL